jgi:hypothetical protein
MVFQTSISTPEQEAEHVVEGLNLLDLPSVSGRKFSPCEHLKTQVTLPLDPANARHGLNIMGELLALGLLVNQDQVRIQGSSISFSFRSIDTRLLEALTRDSVRSTLEKIDFKAGRILTASELRRELGYLESDASKIAVIKVLGERLQGSFPELAQQLLGQVAAILVKDEDLSSDVASWKAALDGPQIGFDQGKAKNEI